MVEIILVFNVIVIHVVHAFVESTKKKYSSTLSFERLILNRLGRMYFKPSGEIDVKNILHSKINFTTSFFFIRFDNLLLILLLLLVNQ